MCHLCGYALRKCDPGIVKAEIDEKRRRVHGDCLCKYLANRQKTAEKLAAMKKTEERKRRVYAKQTPARPHRQPGQYR